MRFARIAVPAALFLAAGLLRGAIPPAASSAAIAPAQTSIYVGKVTLSVGGLGRKDGSYRSTYHARVVPFFFLNEAGDFQIDMPDADVDRLVAGQAVDFTGKAVRKDGIVRPLQGRATPRGAGGGAVKVRIYISRRIVLVFDSTYRLTGPAK
ncbi:MAG TPA: hypothetical protein VHV47_10400 [Opitutaceae bacterium]|jgi:hypothetical protein|nr:hypothetical protein [Opitutaceae bacterium]